MGLCVLPNQNVLGGSLIQNIKAGEQIISGGGNLASVERPFTRAWEGDVISMRGVAMGLRAKVTPEQGTILDVDAVATGCLLYQCVEWLWGLEQKLLQSTSY